MCEDYHPIKSEQTNTGRSRTLTSKAGCGRWCRVYGECGGVAGWKRSSVASLVLVEETWQPSAD